MIATQNAAQNAAQNFDAPLWTAPDAAAAAGGRAVGDWSVTGVSIDSRSLAPGDLFVALTGDARDGHAFVAGALEAGAGAALVSRIPDGVSEDAPLLIVDDTLEGLRGLAAAARARMRGKVVGVTGSVGKTGVKEMLRAALSAQGETHAAEKSYNNHWGVPLTLARMPASTEFAAIEIGMNHPGEITPLTTLARPHAAIVTTVEPVHLEHFRDVEEIADAKAEIFAGLEPGGIAILNRDNRHFARLEQAAVKTGARVIGFGRDPAAEAQLHSVDLGPTATVASARIAGRPIVYRLGSPGRHLAMNGLAVLTAVDAIGANLAKAALALATWTAPAGRGARWRIVLGPDGVDGAIDLLDESYNANPASMGAALEVLSVSKPEDGIGRDFRGRRIAILGDMLELGPREAELHAGLADLPAMRSVDLVVCSGPRMKALHNALEPARRGGWYETSAEAAARARRLIDAGDVVTVKGSLGAKMAVVVDELKKLGEARPVGASGEDET